MPILRKWTDSDLIAAFNSSQSIAQIIKKLNLAVSGGTYENIKRHLDRLNLSFSQDTATRKLAGLKRHQYKNTYLNSDIFVVNSNISQSGLRSRYLKLRTVISCDVCGIYEWNGMELSLEIDHINGIRNDNRLANLRLLCPNCHSQTVTFGSKNIKNKINAPVVQLAETPSSKFG
jgi:ribosomal protein S27E